MECNAPTFDSSAIVMFDLDGTLGGKSEWIGLFHNTRSLFIDGLIYNPPMRMRWSILTARPKMDRMFIKLFCRKHNLKPEEIITSDTFFYKFNSLRDVVYWKYEKAMDRLSKSFFSKLIYVDDDPEVLKLFPKDSSISVCSLDVFNNWLNKGF